jgi:hypothetical protein
VVAASGRKVDGQALLKREADRRLAVQPSSLPSIPKLSIASKILSFGVRPAHDYSQLHMPECLAWKGRATWAEKATEEWGTRSSYSAENGGPTPPRLATECQHRSSCAEDRGWPGKIGVRCSCHSKKVPFEHRIAADGANNEYLIRGAQRSLVHTKRTSAKRRKTNSQ